VPGSRFGINILRQNYDICETQHARHDDRDDDEGDIYHSGGAGAETTGGKKVGVQKTDDTRSDPRQTAAIFSL
jgi:hypothetical protein